MTCQLSGVWIRVRHVPSHVHSARLYSLAKGFGTEGSQPISRRFDVYELRELRRHVIFDRVHSVAYIWFATKQEANAAIVHLNAEYGMQAKEDTRKLVEQYRAAVDMTSAVSCYDDYGSVSIDGRAPTDL